MNKHKAENFFFDNNERPLPMSNRTGCFENPPCLHKPIDGDGDGEKALVNGCAWRLKGRINETVAGGLEKQDPAITVVMDKYMCNTRGFVGKVVDYDGERMLYNPTDKTTRPMSKAGVARGFNSDM